VIVLSRGGGELERASTVGKGFPEESRIRTVGTVILRSTKSRLQLGSWITNIDRESVASNGKKSKVWFIAFWRQNYSETKI